MRCHSVDLQIKIICDDIQKKRISFPSLKCSFTDIQVLMTSAKLFLFRTVLLIISGFAKITKYCLLYQKNNLLPELFKKSYFLRFFMLLFYFPLKKCYRRISTLDVSWNRNISVLCMKYFSQIFSFVKSCSRLKTKLVVSSEYMQLIPTVVYPLRQFYKESKGFHFIQQKLQFQNILKKKHQLICIKISITTMVVVL